MDRSYPTYVLINPASRSGYSLKLWKHQLEPLFQAAGFSCNVLLSEEKDGLTRLAGQITSLQDEDRLNLIILGGDGTLGEVFNGIRDFSRVFLGYIPTGSSNDFARAIGQTDPLEAARSIIDSRKLNACDLGELTYLDETGEQELRRYFLVSAGIGFDAASCEAADRSKLKKILNRIYLGKMVYISSAIRLILTSRLTPMKISVLPEDPTDQPETLFFDRTLFAVCMNHCYEGGGFKFCPDARGEDGKLDLCVAADISRIRFFRLFPTAYDGRHVGREGVTIRQGSAFRIQSSEPLFFHTDGEVTGKTTLMQVRLHRGVLNFWNEFPKMS